MKLKILKIFLPLIVVFVLSLNPPSDADLGWHLKYGEYFFQHGQILRDNIFSNEMPDYKWANSSWATDLISYATFSNFGFLGLSILGAAVISATFYFFAKASKLDYYEKALIFPLLLLFLGPINSVSFRGQLLSLLLTGVLFYILSLYEDGKEKALYILVPIFALWVNIHGQFLFGLILLYIWVAIFLSTTSIKLKKDLLFVTLLSSAATFINPWGIQVYQVTLSHFNNPDLKSIIEYLPFNELSIFWWNQIIVGFILFLGLLFIILNGEIRRKLPWIGPLGLLYALSYWVRRYSWSMYYLSMPLLKPVASFVKPDKERSADFAATAVLLLSIGLTIWIANPFVRIQNMSWDRYCSEALDCSPDSIKYIANNHLERNLMNLYNWGGFMIWNYPGVKPSIDGRMHLWRDQSGYSAFSEYYPIEQNFKDIDETNYDTVLMSPGKPVYKRLKELVKIGKWKLVYEDSKAGIFLRND